MWLSGMQSMTLWMPPAQGFLLPLSGWKLIGGVSERTHCFASAAGPSCTVSPWVQELGFPCFPIKFLIEPLLIPLVSSRIPPSLVLQHATASSGKEVMLRAPREAIFFNFRVDWFQHTKTSKMKILRPCPGHEFCNPCTFLNHCWIVGPSSTVGTCQDWCRTPGHVLFIPWWVPIQWKSVQHFDPMYRA